MHVFAVKTQLYYPTPGLHVSASLLLASPGWSQVYNKK